MDDAATSFLILDSYQSWDYTGTATTMEDIVAELESPNYDHGYNGAKARVHVAQDPTNV